MLRVFGWCVAMLMSSAAVKGQDDSTALWHILKSPVYSIDYPPSWTPNTEGRGQISLYILSPPSSPTDVFRENLTLVKEDLKGDTATAEELGQWSVSSMTSSFEGFSLLFSGSLTNEGGPYYELVFNADQQGRRLQFRQDFRVYRGFSYLLTFTTELDQLDAYKVIRDRMLRSFRFNP